MRQRRGSRFLPGPVVMAIVVIGVAATASIVHAQTVGTGSDTEITVAPGSRVSLIAQVGGPLGVTGGVELLHGLGADFNEIEREERTRGHARFGLVLQVHAGSGGGKLGVGLGAHADVREESPHESVSVRAGAALKLAYVRTWGSPWGTEAGVSYLGPELDLDIMSIVLSGGPLFRVGGAHGDRVLLSWGAGVRF
jgi:hypothetical protein